MKASPNIRVRKRPLAIIEGFSYGRVDHELVQRVREARQRMGAEIVKVEGKARFIDPAELVNA